MLKALLLCIIICLMITNSEVIQYQLLAYNQDYVQQLYRNLIIEQNRRKIQIQNQQSTTFYLQLNKFSKYTQDEFQQKFLTMKVPSAGQIVNFSKLQTPANNVNILSNSILSLSFTTNNYFNLQANQNLDIDWNRAGYVTVPKNQGGCGSCWAFSAVSDLQSSYLLNGHPGNIDLSEQQVLDCSNNFYNFGCSGGWMTNAFAYIYKFPITTQNSYSYIGQQTTCKTTAGTFTLKNLRSYWQNKNCQLLVDILQTRPLAVAVSADPFVWGFYKTGVINKCASAINHGVVVTGVKKTETQNYWIVKNSWGADWGENGYLKIDRSTNDGNTCQICSYPQYSIV